MALSWKRFGEALLGKARDPLSPETRGHIALIAFFAWVGLGADGLSSSCYGPEEAFLALGSQTHLAIFVAIATAFTVFVIALAYNQVIELFPSGGGGYKTATQLLNPYAGLVSGAALIIDYVLTIALSIASATDAIFSLLPPMPLADKLLAEGLLVSLFIIMNLRGMKESIKILMPIFLGFFVTHVSLILYGIFYHSKYLPQIFQAHVTHTFQLSQQTGWFFTIALLVRAYSFGSGTYTGIEAVSNNVNILAEPRVKTGKWTMFYMALSLSFVASGIILLYLLWHVTPEPGKTLNAVVFHKILGDSYFGHIALTVTLLLEAGLLLVGGNTGFLAGPSVLANMAIDGWLPTRFRNLSSRLVTQNGVIVFGIAALVVLLWSLGHVSWLVVLYSINVFITFSLTILGLCVYWWQHRKKDNKPWVRNFIFSLFALCVTVSILVGTLWSKFFSGGWVTIVITCGVVMLCLLTRRYYKKIARQLQQIDELLTPVLTSLPVIEKPSLRPELPTAVLFISEHAGVGMHALLWVLRMFPQHFKNFIFVSTGIVDVESFSGQKTLKLMQKKVEKRLSYFKNYSEQHGLAATYFSNYGADPVSQLTLLSEQVIGQFPNSIFFASTLTFTKDKWMTRFLHNETAYALQRRLHSRSIQLVILPMLVR